MARIKSIPVGEPISREETLRRQRVRLLDFFRRRVGTREDAEDLVQDVFYQLAITENAAQPIEYLSAWLLRVARNKLIDWYRRRRTFARLDFDESDDENVLHLAEILADPGADPQELLERAAFWDDLETALATLPPEQRESFIKHEIEEQSFKEMAEQTGTPVPTLITRKFRAVSKLRLRLRELYDTIEGF